MQNVRVNRATAFAHQEEPSLAIDEKGRLFAGWKEMNSPAEANQIAFATSLDGGFTWSQPVLLERLFPDRGQSDPWLLTGPSGTLLYGQQHSCNIVVATSTDAGTTWTAPTAVHDREGCADKESLVSDGATRVYLVYHNIEPDATSIILTASSDGGRTWSPTTVVARGTGAHYLAPVAAAGPDGRVYVTWWSGSGRNVEVAASTDFGASWGAPVRVNPVPGSVPNVPTPGTYPLFPPFPDVAVNNDGTVFVAWPDYGAGDWDLLVSRSSDGGTWSSPVPISDTTVGNQWMVSLAIDAGDVLHAGWYDSRTGDTHVMYATSSDGGNSWSRSLRVTTEATPGAFNRLGDYLALAVGRDGVAHLAWTDIRGPDMDIYFASVAGGER